MATISPRNKRKQEATAVFIRPKKFMVLVEGDVPDRDTVDEPCPGKSDGEDTKIILTVAPLYMW